jgi:hypothetical protein
LAEGDLSGVVKGWMIIDEEGSRTIFWDSVEENKLLGIKALNVKDNIKETLLFAGKIYACYCG